AANAPTMSTTSDGIVFTNQTFGSTTFTQGSFSNAVQSVNLFGTSLGGSFTLTFGGQTTPAGLLTPTSTAAQVKAALEALTSIGTGNVSVTGSSTASGGTFYIEFTGALANQAVGAITATSSLTGTTPSIQIGQDTTGFSTQSAAPTLQTGVNNSADIVTGSKTLLLSGNLTVSTTGNGATTGTTPPATISGILALGGATRTFTIADTLIPNLADDLVVNAIVTSSGIFGIST